MFVDTGEYAVLELLEKYEETTSSIICANEFRADMMRFMLVGKMIRRYKNSGNINVRLLLNHTIILHNIFESHATYFLISCVTPDIHPELFSLLSTISRLPLKYIGQESIEFNTRIEEELKHAN